MLTLAQPLGVGYARQHALMHVQGPYVAHLDADDIAHPQRLGLQRSFLQAYPEVVLCATDVIHFTHEASRQAFCPIDNYAFKPHRGLSNALRYHMCLRNPVVSSSVMYRRDLALKAGGFDTTLTVAEDYALFTQLLKYGPGSFLPVTLTAYRHHKNSLSHQQSDKMYALALTIGYRLSMHWLNEPASDEVPMWYRWIHSHGNDAGLSLSDAAYACRQWVKLAMACPDSPKLSVLGLLATCLGKTLLGMIIGHRRAISLFTRIHDRVWPQPKSGL